MVTSWTHDPEKPSLHLIDGNHVASVNNKIREEEHSNAECDVEIGTEQADQPEETLHCEESRVVE